MSYLMSNDRVMVHESNEHNTFEVGYQGVFMNFSLHSFHNDGRQSLKDTIPELLLC